VESRLAEIWRDALGSMEIGVNDNFFDMGGHSLKAMQVVSRIHRAFGVDLPLRRLFEAPTIAELAGEVARIDQEAALERILREVELLTDEEAARQLDTQPDDA
jgi:tyrocidine synthetase-3